MERWGRDVDDEKCDDGIIVVSTVISCISTFFVQVGPTTPLATVKEEEEGEA